MSRRMTAPGVWALEDPAKPNRSSRSYASVPVRIGDEMQPVLKYGGLPTSHTGYKQKALRVKP